MENVSDNCDSQAVEAALLYFNSQHVEQRLSGVLVGAIARVDHRRGEHIGKLLGNAGNRVANHHRIGIHGVEGSRCVQDTFGLGDG